MGVTAHFFAYDPRAYDGPPTIDRLHARGDLDDELGVTPGAADRLREIATPLGDNKRWYDNLAGDFAWSCARQHVDGEARAAIDRWRSHLFWDTEAEGCRCGREPTVVAEGEVVYERALLEHIVSLACPLGPVGPALSLEFDGEPPKTERLHQHWIYDLDGFEWLAGEWHAAFERALGAGPGWGLLRWVWY